MVALREWKLRSPVLGDKVEAAHFTPEAACSLQHSFLLPSCQSRTALTIPVLLEEESAFGCPDILVLLLVRNGWRSWLAGHRLDRCDSSLETGWIMPEVVPDIFF
jgi:hypothetical protein